MKIWFLLSSLLLNLYWSNFQIIKKIKLPNLDFEEIEYDGKESFFILSREKGIILRINEDGKILDTIIKQKGEEIGKAKYPADMVYDKERNTILVSDLFLKRISEFNKNGKFLKSFLLPNIVGEFYICGDTIYARYLKEIRQVDSLNDEFFLLHKFDRKNGSFIESIAKEIINKKFQPFFSPPFFIDCKKRLIYMILEPNKIQIRNLKGEVLYQIDNIKWLYLINLFFLDNKYLIISSFKEDERGYIPPKMISIWKRISTHKGIVEEIIKRNLFQIKKSTPMVCEKISYVVDIFDIDKKEFILENLLPPGKLVNVFDGKVFFISSDTLFITKLKIEKDNEKN